jgi:preprotein translocase subunit SecD
MNITGRRLLFSSFSLWMLGAVFALYYLSPLVIPGAPKPIKFGIDLVGGTYISLIVDTDKAIEDTLFERAESVREELKSAKLAVPTKEMRYDKEKKEMILSFASTQDAREAAQFLRDSRSSVKATQAENLVSLSLSSQEQADIRRWAVESNIHVLQNRLDKFAVSEITIAAQGEKNIIVELPNIDDPEKAKAMIGKAAVLEFVLVKAVGMSPEDITEQFDGALPHDTRIVSAKTRRGYEEGRMFYLVSRHADVTGRLLRDARPEFGEMGKVLVGFEFSPEGGKKFYELTSRNVGKTLAVVLDNEIISAATIREAIRNRGSISSDTFTDQEARELADLLKSGAYVAPVKFDEERTVGPSLGAQAIRQGTLACLVGLALLFLFSVLYYKIPGFFAFVTLLYNLLLILLAFAWFGGTLTLPGIAGLILTLGMAIDSSILIYERIKEELRGGSTLQKAIESGFSGALVVILDANITTFIMGVVLFKFGTGPVQGFAITLMIGIATTLITGLFFLRSIFSFFVGGMGVQKMKF